MDDFEAEMVAATQQAERTQQLCSRKRAAPAARAGLAIGTMANRAKAISRNAVI